VPASPVHPVLFYASVDFGKEGGAVFHKTAAEYQPLSPGM
jgi:hypothetical protein